MTAVAPRRPRARKSVTPPPAGNEELKYGSALRALAELSAGPAAGQDLRERLRCLAARSCEVLAIERAAVFVRDDPRDVFIGCAAHPGDSLESAVRRLVLGNPTDRITREILDTRAALLIRDARSDPRALTPAVRAWKLRSLLGVPMIAGSEVLGLLMFDNGAELHRYAPSDLEIASAVGVLAGAMIATDRETSGLRAALETANRQNRLLRRTAVAEHRLAEAILGDGGLRSIVELVGAMTGKPVALYDVHGLAVASCTPENSEMSVTLLQDACAGPPVWGVLREVVPGGSTTIEPTAGGPIRHRHIAAPIDVRGNRWGWLVVMEHPSRLSVFDDFLLRRAATHLALDVAGHRRMASSASDARAMLAKQLVQGKAMPEDLAHDAEYLGVSLAAHRIVAFCAEPPETLDEAALAAALGAITGAGVLAAREPEGVVLLIETPDAESSIHAVRRVKRSLRAVLGDACPERLMVGVSAVCREAADVSAGYSGARQAARCIENFPDGSAHRVLAADDLGPARLFLANGHPQEIARFVEDMLGALLIDEESGPDLLRTLEAFYDTGRSVRLASTRLAVHENTIRYRLARVQAITGLDVAGDADHQLSVQVALLALRLQGHPTLRCFDDDTPKLAELSLVNGG